jgi:NosR/NirI family transcriptional regulator, nitrous oxide reductase regulator
MRSALFRCARRCPLQSIHPDGHINPNACIYCLKCQMLYYNDQVCPHMISRRKRREERAAMRSERRTDGVQAAPLTPPTSGTATPTPREAP